MCETCDPLLHAGRHERPPAGLTTDGERIEVASMGMRADEQYYRCDDCGQRWMHETGNAGMGWLKVSG
ncbi:hypothetical protein [Cellulosimicrobium protaetiae]